MIDRRLDYLPLGVHRYRRPWPATARIILAADTALWGIVFVIALALWLLL